MAVERKSALKKAPTVDVVQALTSSPTSELSDAGAEVLPAPDPVPTRIETAAAEPLTRRGPGRPRSKRRMEPFSSKIEITLRDRMDRYVDEHDMTLVDFIDEAVRARLEQ